MSSVRTEVLTDRSIIQHYKKLYEAGIIDIYRYQRNIERMLSKYRTKRQIREN